MQLSLILSGSCQIHWVSMSQQISQPFFGFVDREVHQTVTTFTVTNNVSTEMEHAPPSFPIESARHCNTPYNVHLWFFSSLSLQVLPHAEQISALNFKLVHSFHGGRWRFFLNGNLDVMIFVDPRTCICSWTWQLPKHSTFSPHVTAWSCTWCVRIASIESQSCKQISSWIFTIREHINETFWRPKSFRKYLLSPRITHQNTPLWRSVQLYARSTAMRSPRSPSLPLSSLRLSSL